MSDESGGSDYESESDVSDSSVSEEEDSDDYSPQPSHGSKRRVKKISSCGDENESSKFEARSMSPSAIGVLNLSESDSSSDDDLPKPPVSLIKDDNKSAYFCDISEPKSEKTDYDFSQILALQNSLARAREQLEKDKSTADLSPSSFEVPEQSVAELLANCEKNTSSAGSSSDVEKDIEPDEHRKKFVQITLENPLNKKLLSKSKKHAAIFERQLQLIRREQQILLHKAHLLCLIAHGNYVNSVIINNEIIYGIILSLLPEDCSRPRNLTMPYIRRVLKGLVKKFTITKDTPKTGKMSVEHLQSVLAEQKNYSVKDIVVLFVSLLRGLGITARFVTSLQPVPLKPKRIAKKKNETNKDIKKKGKVSSTTGEGCSGEKRPKRNLKATSKSGETELSQKASTLQNKQRKIHAGKNKIKVLSSDSDGSTDEKKDNTGVDYWVEVYIEDENKWVSIDVFSMNVNCSLEIYARCTQPVSYIIGWNYDNTLTDITRRYVPAWHVTSKKNRVDEVWFVESVKPFCSKFDKLEEETLAANEAEMTAPIPTKIADLKNHPLYALKRHLLKFEAIYPPDAAPLGFVRGEEVYSRFCVHELFSREKWLRQGKSVQVNETPYKIVKSRSKSDKFPGTDKPLELFGHWQVADYIPPPVMNNKIARNEYGNIEVYKPWMLPAGTVHLQVPGIQKIAKKMDIDCVPAVIGWQHHAGRSHPIIDGVVVCKEFQDTLLDAWCEETDNGIKHSDHKRKQKSFKKWLKFAKHELIRMRLKRKYNFGDTKSEGDSTYEPSQKEKKNS